MARINYLWQDLSLRKSLVLYLVSFALLALILSYGTLFCINQAIENTWASYPATGETYYLTNAQGVQLGDGVLIEKEARELSSTDTFKLTFLNFLSITIAPLYSVLCILMAISLFYKTKLKKPLLLLEQASFKIAQNDLDFIIEYHHQDELGQLCASFEKMRTTLKDNFSKMWRQVEERKQLNVAFAHELRTPLTVLKGYNEILQMNDNPKVSEIATIMGRHLSRMETYISDMSRLKRLEDTEPHYQAILLQPFLTSLYESAEIIGKQNEKRIVFKDETDYTYLTLDTSFISHVCHNLIVNAVRYADTVIELSFYENDSYLCLSVTDDGVGFSQDMLCQAISPYVTTEKNHHEHFGLGLYICKLLCERHGGKLHIQNTRNGAKVTACFKT